jgi:hypothetical protein
MAQQAFINSYPRNSSLVQRVSLIEYRLLLMPKPKFTIHVLPLFDKQQLPLALLSLRPSCQCVAWDEHLCPWRARRSVFFFSKTPMYTDYIDSGTIESTVGKVLNTSNALQPRDAATNDCNIGAIESNLEFQVCGDVTKPGLTRWDGPDTTERLVLDVNTLNQRQQ